MGNTADDERMKVMRDFFAERIGKMSPGTQEILAQPFAVTSLLLAVRMAASAMTFEQIAKDGDFPPELEMQVRMMSELLRATAMDVFVNDFKIAKEAADALLSPPIAKGSRARN